MPQGFTHPWAKSFDRNRAIVTDDGETHWQRLMKRDGGRGERSDGVLANANNLGMETNDGMLRICDRFGNCYDSQLVSPAMAW